MPLIKGHFSSISLTWCCSFLVMHPKKKKKKGLKKSCPLLVLNAEQEGGRRLPMEENNFHDFLNCTTKKTQKIVYVHVCFMYVCLKALGIKGEVDIFGMFGCDCFHQNLFGQENKK